MHWGLLSALLSLLLTQRAVCTVYENDTLLLALRRNAGVFRHEKRANLEKTVLLTGCNHGFLNHLENFRCFAERLDMKFLVIALDFKAFEYIRRNTTMDAIFMSTADVTGDAVDFRSKQFNLITARKKEAVHDVLDLGFDVLFTDTDVALLRDPFPYMLFKNVDYVHSLNAICTATNTWNFRNSREEGNTGFYYVRSSNRTIALWRDAFEAVPKFPGLDDQAVFWRVIRQNRSPPVMPVGDCRDVDWATEKTRLLQKSGAAAVAVAGSAVPDQGEWQGHAKGSYPFTSDNQPLVTCVLDPCVFSSGMLSRAWVPEYTYEELMVNLVKRNETIVSLHANYIKGNKGKMQRLEEYHFWLATKSKHLGTDIDNSYWGGPCLPYEPYPFNFTSAPTPAPPMPPPTPAPKVAVAGAGVGAGAGAGGNGTRGTTRALAGTGDKAEVGSGAGSGAGAGSVSWDSRNLRQQRGWPTGRRLHVYIG